MISKLQFGLVSYLHALKPYKCICTILSQNFHTDCNFQVFSHHPRTVTLIITHQHSFFRIFFSTVPLPFYDECNHSECCFSNIKFTHIFISLSNLCCFEIDSPSQLVAKSYHFPWILSDTGDFLHGYEQCPFSLPETLNWNFNEIFTADLFESYLTWVNFIGATIKIPFCHLTFTVQCLLLLIIFCLDLVDIAHGSFWQCLGSVL